MSTYAGGCAEARVVFQIPDSVPCCSSCHDGEDNEGVELWEDWDLGLNVPPDQCRWWHVCCALTGFVAARKAKAVQ